MGKHDVLTTALGRPEHSGCVRTEGKGVGHRAYWGPSSSSSSQARMDAQVQARVDAQLEA